DAVSNARSCTKNDFGISAVPGVGALEVICYGTANITVDGKTTNGWGIIPLRGSIKPEMIAGRAPKLANEVALGATTMHELGKKIGDDVSAKGPHGRGSRYTIVGETVFPELGQHQDLADGAAFTGAGYAPLFDTNSYFRYFVARFAPGANQSTVLHNVG